MDATPLPPPTMNGVANGAGDGTEITSTGHGRVPVLLAIAFLTVSMITIVSLRIYLRMSTGIKSLRFEDWMHVLAALFSVAVSAAIVISLQFGAGRHKFDISRADTVQGLKFYWISKLLYIAATWVVKMAIFTTLLIIASAPPQQARIFLTAMLYGVMIFMTSYSVVIWVTAVIECRPAEYIFNKSGTMGGQCIPGYLIKGFANAHALMNTVSDLFFVILPVLMVVNGVRRSMSENVALAGVFLLAFFAVGAAAVLALYEFGYHENGELLFDSANLSIWRMTEINVGLIAINLPALSPIFRSLLQPKFRPTRNSYTGPNAPATPTLSTLHSMTQLNCPEIRRGIVNQNPVTCPTSTYPLGMTSNASARYPSDPKANLNEIIMQVDIGAQQHPAFREREGPIVPLENAVTGSHGMGIRRKPTPLAF